MRLSSSVLKLITKLMKMEESQRILLTQQAEMKNMMSHLKLGFLRLFSGIEKKLRKSMNQMNLFAKPYI